MIPKTIHYVWVGNTKKPKLIRKCIKTWLKNLRNYNIIEWNEKNFDINSHPFVRRAYDAKKWAFVSDYIRAWAIYNYGGVYLDTDIILLDNFDKMLSNRAFVGYENYKSPFTAVFGAEANHPFVKDMLDFYENNQMSFNFENNNTNSVSEILIKKYGCKLGNKEQILKNDIKVYQEGVLCNPSKESVSIHVFTGTWLEETPSFLRKFVLFIKTNIRSKAMAGLYRTVFNRKKVKK